MAGGVSKSCARPNCCWSCCCCRCSLVSFFSCSAWLYMWSWYRKNLCKTSRFRIGVSVFWTTVLWQCKGALNEATMDGVALQLHRGHYHDVKLKK